MIITKRIPILMDVSHPRTSCRINPVNDLLKLVYFQPFISILSRWLNLASLIFIVSCLEQLIHRYHPNCPYIYKQDLRPLFISTQEIPLVTPWTRTDLSKKGGLEIHKSRRSISWLISLVDCVTQLQILLMEYSKLTRFFVHFAVSFRA